jgi:hypothetical protein
VNVGQPNAAAIVSYSVAESTAAGVYLSLRSRAFSSRPVFDLRRPDGWTSVPGSTAYASVRYRCVDQDGTIVSMQPWLEGHPKATIRVPRDPGFHGVWHQRRFRVQRAGRVLAVLAVPLQVHNLHRQAPRSSRPMRKSRPLFHHSDSDKIFSAAPCRLGAHRAELQRVRRQQCGGTERRPVSPPIRPSPWDWIRTSTRRPPTDRLADQYRARGYSGGDVFEMDLPIRDGRLSFARRAIYLESPPCESSLHDTPLRTDGAEYCRGLWAQRRHCARCNDGDVIFAGSPVRTRRL